MRSKVQIDYRGYSLAVGKVLTISLQSSVISGVNLQETYSCL